MQSTPRYRYGNHSPAFYHGHEANTASRGTDTRKQSTECCTEDSELATSCLAVANSLGQAAQVVHLLYFHTFIIPPLPEGLDIAEVIDTLEVNHTIVSDRWKAFPKDPVETEGPECSVFANLIGLIQDIVDASCLPGTSPRLRYKSRPESDMSTIYERKSSKPDGYFALVGSERRDGRVYWHQVGVPGEYKKHEYSRAIIKLSAAVTTSGCTCADCALQNRQKTVWDMHQQLREDPRRRFAIGIQHREHSHGGCGSATGLRCWCRRRSTLSRYVCGCLSLRAVVRTTHWH